MSEDAAPYDTAIPYHLLTIPHPDIRINEYHEDVTLQRQVFISVDNVLHYRVSEQVDSNPLVVEFVHDREWKRYISSFNYDETVKQIVQEEERP